MKETSSKKRWKKSGKIIKYIFIVWVLYVVVSMIFPPLYHKRPEEETSLNQGTGKAAGREQVRSIDNNMDALLWRLRLIESAKERIVLATFDFRDDNSGRDMMAALFHAADRGVKVQILVDGLNGNLRLTGNKNFEMLAAHENVEAKLYNPITLVKPWRNNYRMHDKYIIADDKAYILGGRNTDDLFLGNYTNSYNEDRDILVYETIPGEGNSYLQLQEYFETIWNLSCCKVCKGKADPENGLEEHYQRVREKFPEAFGKYDLADETSPAESIELYTNPPEPENKRPQLWHRMAEEMKAADDILIQTPYIICDKRMYQDLTEICADSEKTELIINAVESGTNPFGCTDYLNQKKKVSRTGCDIYEYLRGQALHTKTVLVGDTLSIVGSCNMDMRSIYLDTEMMLFIESRELNQSLREQAEVYKSASRKVSPDGTVTDGEHYQETKPGTGKRIFYGVLRVLIPGFRHLL